MIKKIFFIVSSANQYPYISELLNADFMANVETRIYVSSNLNLKRKLHNTIIKAITSFEKRISSTINPLVKTTLNISNHKLDIKKQHNTLFVELTPANFTIDLGNGNMLMTLNANNKNHCYIDTLVWQNEGLAIELSSILNYDTNILTYTTSNNSPLLTQRIKNLNGVFHDLLYYSIKKILQK